VISVDFQFKTEMHTTNSAVTEKQSIYLLNTQLVQDIIKTMYTHRNEKKKHKTLWKKCIHT